MNKFEKAIKELDYDVLKDFVKSEPKWLSWTDKNGRNALHLVSDVKVVSESEEAENSVRIFKHFLKNGMDIDSIHRIPETGSFFPATALWHAYTRGRNEKLYTWLLRKGANPDHCMFAIAWYDDPKAATLFKKHGAKITDDNGRDNPFLAAYCWKKFKITKWFLENGADVNFADKDGNTALHFAVKRKFDYDQIEFLLKNKANINQQNHAGLSPKKLAEEKRYRKIVELFKKYEK
jgi:hypothetical protein